jgi:K+/H+ antiporter YhaU regulatory subunit KhtT
MRHFLDNRFPGLRDAIHRNRQEKALRRSRVAEVINTVENVVDGTDSKIRLVPGYKKKLQNIIQSSLEFADDLVDQIPKAIEVSGHTFASDPYVNAFFTNVTDLQSIVCHSSEIHDYMEDNNDDSGSCCALLCMKRTEKTVMGMELSGSMLKRDVLQVAVSFSDHRIYSPAPSEPETREGLKTCLFHGLTTNALERIAKLQLASHRLQSQRQMLQARLRRYRQKTRELTQDTRTAGKIAQAIEETSQELGKTEEQMLHTPLLTPQVALEQVMDVFGNPDDFIRIRRFPLSLNKMGIKVSYDSPQPVNKLNLTEVSIGNELPRVVTLAMFPGKELATGAVFSVPG